MKVLPLSEVKSKLSELVDVVERRAAVVKITRNGRAVAIIVSKDERQGGRATVAITNDERSCRRFAPAYDLSGAPRSATRFKNCSKTDRRAVHADAAYGAALDSQGSEVF